MAQAMRAMQVTALNGALAGSSQTVDTSASFRSSRRVPKTRRPALSLRASLKDEHDAQVSVLTPATIASLVALADAGAANALTAEDVTGAYLKVQSTASQVSNVASETFGVAKNVVGQVVDTVKPAVNAAIPYVKQSADAVYRTVFPFATDLEQQAEKALQSSGVDTKPVLEAAKTAASAAGEVGRYVEGAQPTILSTLQNILSSDPVVLATGAGALLLLYLLAPPLLSSVSYAARGFRGFGFNSTWVVTDGFDGGRGWVQSRLGTESSGTTSFTEILSPSRVISGTKFLQAGSD